MSAEAFKSATELAGALRSGRLKSRELLEIYLDRVERYNPQVNAIVHLKAGEARKRADEADAALSRGEVWGPLHGLPMTIKELFEVEGFRWTAGDPQFAKRVADANAPAVQALLDAGAVLFGVTNSPLNGLDAQTYNEVYGTTNNPWDLARSPGGSSGGAAAVLAAGLGGFELGSDIGGSIRSPAHYTGVYGHKPTYGIVPRRRLKIPGPLAVSDLSVAGPMGRSADDLALGMEILVAPEVDQREAWRIELPPPRNTTLTGFRVAAWLDDRDCPVDAVVLERLHTTVEALGKAGVKVDEKARPDIPRFSEVDRIYRSLLVSATAPRSVSDDSFPRLAGEEDALAWETEESGPEAPHNGAMRHLTWQHLNEKRLQIREKWEAFFQDFDVMLMPVTQVTALPHDHSKPQRDRVMTVNGSPWPYTDQLAWVGLVTMAYLPSTAAPVGSASNGLPVGIQIVSGYGEDRTTIEFAKHLARVIGGFTPPPGYAE
jgi:amidase